MKSYIYYCPKCNQFYSQENARPENASKCSRCKTVLKYTGISEEEWDSKTKAEIAIIKYQYAEEAQNNSDEINELLECVKTITHDVHFVYCLNVFMIVLAIIGIFIAFMAMIS